MLTAERGGEAPLDVFDASYNADELLGLPALSEELLETTLHPYDDDVFLGTRLQAQSRVLRRNPAATQFIGEVLAADDDDSLIAITDELDDAWATATTGNEPAVAKILSYLTLIQGIETIHDDTLGQAAPNDRTNALAHLLGRKLSQHVPDNRVAEFMLSNQYVSKRIKEATLDRSIDRRFINVKLRMLNDLLTSRALGIAYANAIPAQDIEPVDTETIERDTEAIAEKFSQMRAAQHYGIKLAYKRHFLGGSMIYNEPATLNDFTISKPQNVHPLTIESPAVAELTHSRKTSHQTLKRKEDHVAEGDAIGMTYGKIGTISLFYLDGRGELYVDRFCEYSVRDIFVSHQKYGAYRALQADVLASYFDLTQPARIVNRVKHDTPASAAAPTYAETPAEVINRLLLPRIKAVTAAEAADQPEEDEGPVRSLKYHGVTWHRRQLPEGWSPSPQALELAEAAHVVLKPGETFVKAHHRGSKLVGEVVAHQMFDQA